MAITYAYSYKYSKLYNTHIALTEKLGVNDYKQP